MANFPAPLIRNEGDTLSLQTTLSTTTAGNTFYQFLPNVHQVILYNPTEDWRLHFNPAITDIAWYDASATADARFKVAGSTTTLKRDLTDSDSGTGSGTAWDSFTTSDYIYICTADIVGGFWFNVKAANTTAGTIVVEYYDGSTTWASLTETDNTDTGASMAVDGSVTWTAPTDANMASLGGPNGILQNDNTFVDLTDATKRPPANDPNCPGTRGFWWRISFTTGGFDSDTEIEEIHTINKDTRRGYYRAGVEYPFSLDRRAIGSMEALTTANTDTMQITSLRTRQ